MADDDLDAAIKKADSSVTVLDDKLDVENAAIFKWLRAHELHAGHLRQLAIGNDPLPAAWQARAVHFTDLTDARALLARTRHDGHALIALRKLHALIGGTAGTADKAVLEALAAALVAKSLWAIEVKRMPNRWTGKTDTAVFARINTALKTNVDFVFIAAQEGDQWLRGYVPMDKAGKVIGKSGMTIATGFDIGQWSPDELGKLGLAKPLLDELKPFAAPNNFKGMTKVEVAAAVAKLGPVPVIEKAEADQIDEVVMTALLKTAMRNWDRAKGKGVPAFVDLPSGWQTVWLSRTYQEGPNTSYGGAFGTLARKGDWAAAIVALRAQAQYKSRKEQEAKQLEAALPPPVAQPPKPGAPAAPGAQPAPRLP